MHKPVSRRRLVSTALMSVALAVWSGIGIATTTVDAAPAITAVAVDIASTANCTSNATLNLSWTGAGNHWEYGAALDASGSVIGTFGPESNTNTDWDGTYAIPITTAQPAGSLVGSYAWVGTNPPTAGTSIEYFVVYNCSTQQVLYSCSGTYGQCKRTVGAALAAPVFYNPIPATAREMLAVLILLLAGSGGAFLHRRTVAARKIEQRK